MTKQEIQQQIDNIRQLLIQGKTIPAIEMLIKFVSNFNKDEYRDAAINISGNKKELIKEELQVVTSSDDLASRKSKINRQILSLLTLIENEQIEGRTVLDTSILTEKPSASKKNNNNIVAMVIGALAMIGLLYFFVFRGNNASSAALPCDASFEQAKSLFQKGDYSSARLAFLEIKTHSDCQSRVEVIDEYITQCNEQEGGDEFKVFKIEFNSTPQNYTGECPVSYFFFGKIYTNQKEGKLTYCFDFNGKDGTNCLEIPINNGIAEFARSFEFDEALIQKRGKEIDVEALVIVDNKVVERSDPLHISINCQTEDEPDAMPQATIQDKRDGRNYPFLRIGKDIWLAKNMTYKSEKADCIVNDCENFGRIYSQTEARNACPAAYTTPSTEQFLALKNTVGSFDAIVERLNIQPIRENKAEYWAYSKEAKEWKIVVFDFNGKRVNVQSPAQNQKYFCRCVNMKLNLVNPQILKDIQTKPTINPNLIKQPTILKPKN